MESAQSVCVIGQLERIIDGIACQYIDEAKTGLREMHQVILRDPAMTRELEQVIDLACADAYDKILLGRDYLRAISILIRLLGRVRRECVGCRLADDAASGN